MKLNQLFIRKEKSEIEKKISRLKKIIHKKDEMSAQESVEILSELTKSNQDLFAERLTKLSEKRNRFIDGLSAIMVRMDNDSFTDDVVQIILDYCFRYGNTEIQRNGVLLLNKYKSSKKLYARYSLIFLKDKKAAKLLKEKVYCD